MGKVSAVLARSATMTKNMISHPGDSKFVVPWLKTLQQSTLDLRLPWLPFSLITILENELTAQSRAFEYGGGGSTLWLSDHVSEVVTVEHDQVWVRVLEKAVVGIPGCVVLNRDDDDNYQSYVDAILEYPEGHFDLVVVDGRERVRCFEVAMSKVRPGGLLILDDTDRPRYAPAFDIARDWSSETFCGLTPTKRKLGTTTMWRRPNEFIT